VATQAERPAPADDELETLDDGDLDDLEMLDANDDEDSIELMDGVETPPAELRGDALDLDTDPGHPADPVPIETATPPTPEDPGEGQEPDARDAYLGDASTDLSGSPNDPETGSK